MSAPRARWPAPAGPLHARVRLDDIRGLTLVELLVTLGLVLLVSGLLAHLAAEARAVFMAQPEAMDVVQRARVGLASLTRDLALSGGGPWRTRYPGLLVRWIAPIHPRRLGPVAADPETSAFADRVTVLTVPDGAAQAEVGDMASAGDPVPLQSGAVCPQADPLCGFRSSQHGLLFDRTGAFHPFVIAAADPGLVSPLASVAKAWRADDEAQAAGVRITTYYVDRTRRQLRRYDGHRSDLPVLDETVGLMLRYFGDPLPPIEPRPPPGQENCVVDGAGSARLPVLSPDRGALIELTPAMMSDGPWCGVPPFRYDADLLRVRRVRVRLRVQAASAEVRGRDAAKFVHPGLARDVGVEVPDLEIEVDVAPRNLRRP
jgi:hypothetical protein